jgi:hypothetical protein
MRQVETGRDEIRQGITTKSGGKVRVRRKRGTPKPNPNPDPHPDPHLNGEGGGLTFPVLVQIEADKTTIFA